jgi:endo-1,3-1,4-beta-glycanase ExoK
LTTAGLPPASSNARAFLPTARLKPWQNLQWRRKPPRLGLNLSLGASDRMLKCFVKRRLSLMVKVLTAVACLLAASTIAGAAPRNSNRNSACSAWNETFSSGKLDPSRWVVGDDRAVGTTSTNAGYYDPSNVQVTPGVLRLALRQVAGTDAGTFISYGGMVRAKQPCGYGTYQWTMRMSSTASCPRSACQGESVSGSVSAGFIYINNSETEIDFEFEGQDAKSVHLVNWLNVNPDKDPGDDEKTSYQHTPFDPIDRLHRYKFIWTPGKISYYIDGKLIVEQTTNVPSAPAYFRINHWGTNNPHWGGSATAGTIRYMYITQASYRPGN